MGVTGGSLAYTDASLLSLLLGRDRRAGEGLVLDGEVKFDADRSSPWDGGHAADVDAAEDDDAAPAPPLFRVRALVLDVPRLTLRIERSRH
jgi:hypothetical protein